MPLKKESEAKNDMVKSNILFNIIIFMPSVICFQVFLSNKNNLQAFVCFHVTTTTTIQRPGQSLL